MAGTALADVDYAITAPSLAFIGDRETFCAPASVRATAMALNTQHLPSADQIRCSRCGGAPRLLQKFVNTRSGSNVRVYQCACGEQIWHDEAEQGRSRSTR